MTKTVEELKKYRGYKKEEVKISKLLEKNKGNAFTVDEIRNNLKAERIPIKPGPDNFWDNVLTVTSNVLTGIGFRDKLEKMVEEGKIRKEHFDFEEYYYLE